VDENAQLPTPNDDTDAPQDESAKRALQPVALSIEDALNVLTKGSITEEHGSIRWSSNHTFLLSVTLDAVTVLAIYKPRRGERPLWDFPDGTLSLRERASFLTSQQLGWQIVPPTVLRDGPRGFGSMQLFIDHDPNVTYFEFDSRMHSQLARLALFDTITNNADRKGGHCLKDADGHLWGIDHGLTFNVAHKLRTVIWDFAGQRLPDALRQDLETLCAILGQPAHPYTAELCQLLTNDEVSAFERRVEKLLKAGVYPRPGPGPNYPWPPV